MVQTKNPEFLGILFGSPFAFIGLIFLMKGKFGVGITFLMLALGPALAGTAIGRRSAASAAAGQEVSLQEPGDRKPAEPGA